MSLLTVLMATYIPHQPMAWLDPQVQFQFAIDPVDALVVPFKPLHIAQI